MKKDRKTVLVTGSSRGIGAAIAECFAKENYNIVLNCIHNKELLDQHAHKLKSLCGNVLALQADVSDYSQVRKMFHEIEQHFGPVDILVNNAGIASYGLFTDTMPDNWNHILHANFYSVLNCCHLAIGNMVRNKYGRIINISSVWGNHGASCEALYSAAKGAVNTFTKALARELGPSGITVNAIACGFIDTDMNSNLSSDEKNALKEDIPLMRFGSAEEIGALALYLAEEKGSYITGQIITVDGGWL